MTAPARSHVWREKLLRMMKRVLAAGLVIIMEMYDLAATWAEHYEIEERLLQLKRGLKCTRCLSCCSASEPSVRCIKPPCFFKAVRLESLSTLAYLESSV